MVCRDWDNRVRDHLVVQVLAHELVEEHHSLLCSQVFHALHDKPVFLAEAPDDCDQLSLLGRVDLDVLRDKLVYDNQIFIVLKTGRFKLPF